MDNIEQSMRDIDLEFEENKVSQAKVDGAAHQAEMEAYCSPIDGFGIPPSGVCLP